MNNMEDFEIIKARLDEAYERICRLVDEYLAEN